MNSNIYEDFDRSKIYEKLASEPEPKDYNGDLPWIVQQQIAGTNGIHYVDRIGKLTGYPRYNLPVPKVSTGLMLDIGTGWGRWLIAGEEKGYIPIGADIRLEFCETAIETLKNNNKVGYAVVADLKNLPFKDNVFDLIWSFSVIQHTSKERYISCLNHINRMLKQSGFTYLEFPNKNGIRNRRGAAKLSEAIENDNLSWGVRYYSIEEYKKMFLSIFGNFQYDVHSALGIGILLEDLKYVSLKNKLKCGVSLATTGVLKSFDFLKGMADSIYIKAEKFKEQQKIDAGDNLNAINSFLMNHTSNPRNNLNIIPLLRCPISGNDLIQSDDGKWLIALKGSVKYPVINNIPVLITSEAVSN